MLSLNHRSPAEAFSRLLQEIQAVPLGELDPVNLDVRAVVMTVLGVWARIGPLREAMRRLPLDQEAIDELPEYAQALAHAQALYKIQAVPPNILAEKARRARTLRDLLFSDALALVKRGVLDGRALGAMKRTTGYCRTGFDLLALTTLFRQNWPQLVNRTMVTREELGDAERMGSELMVLTGQRAQAPTLLAESGRLRAQAYTLVLRAYSELRQGVGFLRWKAGDAEQVAPSLYSRRAGTRRRRNAPEPALSPMPEVVVTAESVAPANAPLATGIPMVASPELPSPSAIAPAALPAANGRLSCARCPAAPVTPQSPVAPAASLPMPPLALQSPNKPTKKKARRPSGKRRKANRRPRRSRSPAGMAS